jgi:hypothetical protein
VPVRCEDRHGRHCKGDIACQREIPRGVENCFRVVMVEAELFYRLADMQGNLFLCGATVHPGRA